MYSSLCIKPYHLPIMVTMAFVLLTQSDARMPRKPRVITGKPQLLHKKTALAHVNPGFLAPSQVVDFSKRMYKELGGKNSGNITLTSEDFQAEFDQINVLSHGELAKSLSSLFEIRMLDLQLSIRHARKLRDAVDQLVKNSPLPPDCVSCNINSGV